MRSPLGRARGESSQNRVLGVMAEIKANQQQRIEKTPKCSLCGKTSTRLVDGEPSCDDHIELVYENQVEDYTLEHQKRNDWLEP